MLNSLKGHSLLNKGYLKLYKALYGLKQVDKEWNEKFNNVLINLTFVKLVSEPYIYNERCKEVVCILSVFVDDILLVRMNEEILKIKKQIK